MVAQAEPLGPADLDALAVAILGTGVERLLVLAVSGGVDSMCLMHIAAELAPRRPGTRIEVVTIDHGLRAESADEARFVAAEAAKLGLTHTTKVWSGTKPATAIQSAARAARYRLLAEARAAFSFAGEKIVMTAHTEDDQAETVLMRLARGSGVDGLSGMSPHEMMPVALAESEDGAAFLTPSPCSTTFPLARPFLGIAKARLVATMRARGLAWREDSSNLDPAFERVRIRDAMAQLAVAGIGAPAIARSARRLAAAREVMEDATRRILADAALVRVDPLGFVELDASIWRRPADAVGVRVLGAAIRMVGAAQQPVSLQALEDLADRLAAGRDGATGDAAAGAGVGTLGLCRVTRSVSKVYVLREEGRLPPPPVKLAPGEEKVFDRRFVVGLSTAAPRGYEVRALGVEGVRELRELGFVPKGAPNAALRLLPAFRTEAGLAAVPGATAGLTLAAIGAACAFVGLPGAQGCVRS